VGQPIQKEKTKRVTKKKLKKKKNRCLPTNLKH